MLILFFLISLLWAALNTGLFIHAFANSSFSFMQENAQKVERSVPLSQKLSLLKYEPMAVCISLLTLNAFVLISTIIVYINFEKTQALEIIYFMGLMFSCQIETLRLLIPVLPEEYMPPSSIAIITRCVLSARILAPLSFLFSELFSDTESRQFVEHNFIIMIIVAIFTGALFPINSLHQSSIFIYTWGMRSLFQSIRVLIVITTLLAVIARMAASYSLEIIHEAIGFLITISGYFILCNSDNYILAAVGTVALFAGSFYYLNAMHKIYLWR